MIWDVVNSDCIEGLSRIGDGMADLVIADPPYNIGIDYGDGRRRDKLSDEEYIAWTRAWIAECARVLADEGSMVVICGQEYAGDHQIAMREAGLHWRNTVTWHETFGVWCRRKFARTSRPCLYFTKHPRRFAFNASELLTDSARGRLGDRRAPPGGKKILGDVWQIARVCGTFGERVDGVPTQLPAELVRRFVLGLSSPGDLVIDPFAGSGTTGAVAVEHGRMFLGFELRERFAEIARERIRSVGAA